MKIVICLSLIFCFIGIQAQDVDNIIEQSVQLQNQGKYHQAIELLENHKITLTKKNKDNNNNNYQDYAIILNRLGDLYLHTEDDTKAEFYYLEAEKIYNIFLKDESVHYSFLLDDIGYLYDYRLPDYNKAKKYYLKAKRIKEENLKEYPDNYLTSLIFLGSLCYKMEDYTEAEIYFSEAKVFYEKTDKKNHQNYKTAINYLYLIYRKLDDYIKVGECVLDLAIYKMEKTGDELGINHPDYAKSLCEVGEAYNYTGDYDKAESYFLEAKRLQEENDENGLIYAKVLSGLGVLYNHMADYQKAEKYFLKANQIYDKKSGEEFWAYVTSLTNLGSVYENLRDYTQAKNYYLKAKTICEKKTDKEKPTHGAAYIYVSILNKLGILDHLHMNYTQAKDHYSEAISICEKTFDNLHPRYAWSLTNMGILYRDIGEYVKSEGYLSKAQIIYEKNFSPEHPDYVLTMNNLSVSYLFMGNYPKARSIREEIDRVLMSQINKNFTFLSERQRSLFWEKICYNFDMSYSLAYSYPLDTAMTQAYNNILFGKGLLLRTLTGIRNAIYSSGDDILIEKYEQLGDIRQKINTLQSQKIPDNKLIKTLEQTADSLDKNLTFMSVAYRDIKDDLFMKWENVKGNLNDNEVAIEFFHFKYYDKKWTDSTFYCAMVLKKNDVIPRWVTLCEERQLQELLNGNKQYLYTETENSLLYHLVWQPLEKELQNAQTIYYSPSGLLHQISFAAIPFNNKTLIDKYNLQLVSSTREIGKIKDVENRKPEIFAAIYGGLWYDADKDRLTRASEGYTNSNLYANTTLPVDRQRGYHWEYLEGTKHEVENIGKYLNKKSICNHLYTEAEGNEESFKKLNGTHTDIIHLATHGFFLADIERQSDLEIIKRLGGNNENAFKNPLLRSGLLMAGANRAWTGQNVIKGIEDGILTADEISRLDLSKTQLVVLSACETGLGEIRNSEGVFGLQRAFKLAGVESIIMSLWKVPDQATSELMSVFYEQWLSGKTKHESFSMAQKQIRKKYKEPYYWAGFVIQD